MLRKSADEKKNAARRSFKKWKKLLTRNKYVSKVNMYIQYVECHDLKLLTKEDGIVDRPALRYVKHLNSWNDDPDMRAYYACIDDKELL